MTNKEMSRLNTLIANNIQHRSDIIQQTLESSSEQIDKFYDDIPNIAENIKYKEEMSAVVNNIVNELNQEFLKNLDAYMTDILKSKNRSILYLWIVIAVVFVLEMFILIMLRH